MNDTSAFSGLVWLALLAAATVTFLPFAIAVWRKHQYRVAIGVTNAIAAALPFGACSLSLLADDGLSEQATSLAVNAAMLVGLEAGVPVWLGALIWSATPVRRQELAPSIARRAA